MSTLNELNRLRVAAGMKPLKAWKESKAKLDAAVAKMKSNAKVADEIFTDSIKQDKIDAAKADTKTAVAKSDKKTTPKAAKPAKAAKKDAPEGVSISTIAAECDMDPKVARAKLRRQDEVPCIEGSQWLFDKKDVPAIKAILKGDARKKD